LASRILFISVLYQFLKRNEKELKMQQKLVYITVLLMLTFCFAFGVNAAELTPQYLQGEWAVGTTEQNCDSAESEHLTFRENGSFEGERAGKVEAAGLWSIAEGCIVELHIVSSPSFFGDIHEELKAVEESYHYFNIKIIPYNMENGKFEAVGVIGEMIKRGVFVKCK
jgi:hypothetical protein